MLSTELVRPSERGDAKRMQVPRPPRQRARSGAASCNFVSQNRRAPVASRFVSGPAELPACLPRSLQRRETAFPQHSELKLNSWIKVSAHLLLHHGKKVGKTSDRWAHFSAGRKVSVCWLGLLGPRPAPQVPEFSSHPGPPAQEAPLRKKPLPEPLAASLEVRHGAKSHGC